MLLLAKFLKYQSFTLTMWDVKLSNRSFESGNETSFTLTMWDVKKLYRCLHRV